MYFAIPDSNVRVLGSLHMLPAHAQGLPKFANDAYAWAQALVFEGDPSCFLRHIRGAGHIRLRDGASKHAQRELEKLWLGKREFPPLPALHPWAILICAAVFAMGSIEGVEGTFLRSARRDGLAISFFEEPQDLPAKLAGIPETDVYAAIEELAADIDAPRRDLVEMHEAWTERDGNRLYQIIARTHAYQNANIRNAMFLRRNKEWSEKTRSLLDRPERTLVAVGAGHLFGPGNFFELLNITPLPITD